MRWSPTPGAWASRACSRSPTCPASSRRWASPCARTTTCHTRCSTTACTARNSRRATRSRWSACSTRRRRRACSASRSARSRCRRARTRTAEKPRWSPARGGSLRGMGYEYIMLRIYFCALALALVVGVPQPFSMPPQPEDPALLRMVPKDCICAATWSGAAAPAADSRNRTELLCAEPEVRRSLLALRSAVEGMFQRGGPAAASIARAGITVAGDALQHPGCAFVRSIAHRPQKTLAAGIALHLGADMAAAKVLLGLLGTALRAQQGAGAELHDDVEVDDVRFRALPTDVAHPFLGWAEVDGWLLVAIGEGVCTQLVHGLRGSAEGLRGEGAVQRLLAATAVARPATRTFVDCQRMLAALAAMGSDANSAAVARFADALGLARAGAALSTTGLDADGFAARVHVDLTERTGLLAALAARPLAQDALLTMPADADVAVALHVEPVALEEALLALCGAIVGDDLQDDYESFQREFAAHVGVAWRSDLLLRLDGQLALWNAPSQGGL